MRFVIGRPVRSGQGAVRKQKRLVRSGQGAVREQKRLVRVILTGRSSPPWR